jgi:hypothetical protein
MIILTQAADGGTWIFLALFIVIGLFALAAWATHWIWYFRSFGMFATGNVVLSAPFVLGVIGLVVPIVGIIHGVAIWAGGGARVGHEPRTTFDDLPIEQRASPLRRLMLLFGAAIIVCTGMTAYELVQLEYGGAERVTVWAPVAGLYNALGFWPAVLFFPALGLLGITPMARKLRAVNATRSMITGPQ